MIEKICKRAEYLEMTQMTEDEEPEIGINEETNMITISKYSEIKGRSVYIEDFCDVIDVNMEKLRRVLDKTNIAYVL